MIQWNIKHVFIQEMEKYSKFYYLLFYIYKTIYWLDDSLLADSEIPINFSFLWSLPLPLSILYCFVIFLFTLVNIEWVWIKPLSYLASYISSCLTKIPNKLSHTKLATPNKPIPEPIDISNVTISNLFYYNLLLYILPVPSIVTIIFIPNIFHKSLYSIPFS